MFQKTLQIQEIDILQINLLIFDHLKFHVNQFINLVLDIVISKKDLVLIELHQLQCKLNFKTSEQILGLLTALLSETIAIVLCPDPSIKIDSTLGIIILQTDLHQDHVHDLRLHKEDLLIIYDYNHWNFMTNKQKIFPFRKTSLKVLCIHWNNNCSKSNKLVA